MCKFYVTFSRGLEPIHTRYGSNDNQIIPFEFILVKQGSLQSYVCVRGQLTETPLKNLPHDE